MNGKPNRPEVPLSRKRAVLTTTRLAVIYFSLIVLSSAAYLYVVPGGSAGGTFSPTKIRELFSLISGVQLILIAFMGPVMTAGTAGPGFMLLLIGSTVPFAIAGFWLGGFPPAVAASVYAFEVFVLFVLRTVGFFCRALLKRTKAAVIFTDVFALIMYIFTGICANLPAADGGIPQGLMLGLNPMGALISILNPDFGGDLSSNHWHVRLWQVFVTVYTAGSVLLLLLGIRLTKYKRGKN